MNGLLARQTPSVTLSVSPNAISEDGDTNLIDRSKRTGEMSSALTENYAVSGTVNLYGRLGILADYSGNPLPQDQISHFLGNSDTVTVKAAPVSDIRGEENEMFALMLKDGSGHEIATPYIVTRTFLHDDLPGGFRRDHLSGGPLPETIDGTGNQDVLTGGDGPDTFAFRLGDFTLIAPDPITDFESGRDKICLCSRLGSALPAPAVLRRASSSKTATNLIQLAAAVFSDADASLLGEQSLRAHEAALVVAATSRIAGAHLIINNASLFALASSIVDLVIKLTSLN